MPDVALSTHGLTRRFGDLTAVAGLDLEVRRGEVFGFLGPNGAGKTTTIRMIAGLLRPTEGKVVVEGRVVTPSDRDARRLVGLCPQENILYPDLTAHENLAYLGGLFGLSRADRARRAEALLERLGLQEKRDVRAQHLSGGMKRRLALATALVHDPPVVVLDEPEAGLDPQTRLLVREFLRDERRARTVVLTSHNMDEVERVADRVAIVEKGRLLALGTPAALTEGLGERLEVALAAGDPARVAAMLVGAGFDALVAGASVHVQGSGLAKRLPAVVEAVARAGGDAGDVRLRRATLEDAFIQLTGRGLRE